MQNHVGGLVRRRREALGLTQRDLAARTGLEQTYISRIERGEVAVPQRDTLERIGRPLGITLPEFYREAGMLEGIDAAEPPRPFYGDGDPRAGYTPREIAEIVAFVESRPGERFREQLREEREGRSRESYERFCVSLFTAWGANAQLAFSASRNGAAS